MLCGIGGFVKAQDSTIINVFDEVLYYDGYNQTIFDADLEDGVLRHANYLYAKKLTEAQLAQFGSKIRMDIRVKASCDNYDRIGNVNIAFVPKGEETYIPDSVQRIEIGRFITPFMDKNKKPDTVPYTFDVDYLVHVFRDIATLEEYDIWVELEIFGVPYAANEQIAGCADCSDVFFGSLDFVTKETLSGNEDNNVLIPLYMKHNFNNYTEGATDVIGSTELTKEFCLDEDLSDAKLVLITSNHGSNAGGEEYNRRLHYVYLDGENISTYKPGRVSCEPFRVYNTQLNGIYGYRARTNSEWQSFSNWCPGDKIDNREYNLGAITAGTHTFKISVPDALFKSGQGNIPISLYLIGKTEGKLFTEEINTYDDNTVIYPNPATNSLAINSVKEIELVQVYNLNGQLVKSSTESKMDIHDLNIGIFTVTVSFMDGSVKNLKLIKN